MYACLAVTCHLHFWQNDRDFLRATAVTRGWNGYRNKSRHRKSTLEKKILPPFQQGFEPATFQSRVRCSNHWAIPAPSLWQTKKTKYISKALKSISSMLGLPFKSNIFTGIKKVAQYATVTCTIWQGTLAAFSQWLWFCSERNFFSGYGFVVREISSVVMIL